MRTLILSLALLSAPTLTWAAPAPAQATSDAEIRRDIEFARGLAADWSFVDLSEAVLQRIEQGGVSSRMATELALVKCEVFAVGARNSRNAADRNRLYEEALSAYKTFLRDHSQTDKRAAAEAGFVAVSADYATSLTRSLEEAVGEEAEALRKRQEEVLGEAVSKTGDLIANLKALRDRDELTEAQKRELYELMLNRGRMLLELAKAQEDGGFNFEQAHQTLEDLVFTAGEGTPYALRAFIGLGDVYAAQDQLETAAIFYEQVVESVIPIDRKTWDDISKDMQPGQKELHWLFMQLGTEGLVDSLRLNGQAEQAMRWGLHFYNTQRREGFSFQPIGYLSLLSVARAALDAGGWIGGSLSGGEAQWYATLEEAEGAGHRARNLRSSIDLALSLADQIGKDNPRSILKVYAQKVISDAISRPGVEVDPDVLLEAAMGSYNEKEYHEAIRGFQRVLRAIDGRDQASQLQAPKALHYIGQSFYRLDRPLEAAMAFREGVTRFRGDPEFDPKNSQGYYSAMKLVRQGITDEPTIQELVKEAEKLQLEVGEGDVGKILLQNGDRARENKEWEAAIAEYQKIPPESDQYEKAMVFIGVSRYRNGETDPAFKIFDDYLERYLADPTNATTSPVKLAARNEAKATADFYRGLIASKKGEKGELELQKVVDYLHGFHERYPEQDKMAPFAMRLEVLALLAMDRFPEARELFSTMTAAFPDSDHTGSAAIEFYKTLDTRREAALKAGETEKAAGLLREMAELLKLGNQTAKSPNWANFRREGDHWMKLGDWQESERVLRRSIEIWESDLEHALDVKKYVLKDLAEVLLEQNRMPEALELLQILLDAEDVPRTKALAIDYSRAVIGYVRGVKEPFEIVPGAGTTDEEFAKATEFLDQIMNSVEKYSCDWLDLKFELSYAYYVWGQKKSTHLDSARTQLGPLETDYSAGFRDVDSACEGDPARGEALRRRLVWLKEKVK